MSQLEIKKSFMIHLEWTILVFHSKSHVILHCKIILSEDCVSRRYIEKARYSILRYEEVKDLVTSLFKPILLKLDDRTRCIVKNFSSRSYVVSKHAKTIYCSIIVIYRNKFKFSFRS